MNILIVEDEPIIARRIRRIVGEQLSLNMAQIAICHSLESGLAHVGQHPIDLLFLDLNLNGESGFDILESMVAQSFHTIIISAYKDKAITAFEYGVLDFVPKPFNEERIAQALQRIQTYTGPGSSQIKYLSIQKKGRHVLKEVEKLMYAKGAGIYSELYFKDGSKEVHNKNLDKLTQLLPDYFDRIHKSYIINSSLIQGLQAQTGSKYSVELADNIILPVSRIRYKYLKEKWAI